MVLNNLWFPPSLGVVKISVHGSFEEEPLINGNLNSIGMVARDHEARYFT